MRLSFLPYATAFIFLALSSCSKEGVKPCENEQKLVQQDGKIRVQTVLSPVDVSAQGRLSGKALSGARAMNAVLLLDYSGSMYGGYAKPKVPGCERCKANNQKRNKQPYYYSDPAFRSMVADWFKSAAPEGAEVNAEILLFNTALFRIAKDQKLEKVTSQTPRDFSLPLHSSSSFDIAEQLKKIPGDPFKGSGRNANETHLKNALLRAAERVGDDGIVWIITDNIADQSGVGVSAQDARRNLDFYNALNDDPRLQTVVAYPLHDAEMCTPLCGTSLFVYGIHVSSRERAKPIEVDRMSGGHLQKNEAQKDGLLWNVALKQKASAHAGKKSNAKIVGVPLRLKPMDLDVVSVRFDQDPRGRPLPIRCRRTAEFGEKVPCVATVVVRNNLRHQRLDRATLVFENDVLIPHKRGEKKRLPWAGAVCEKKMSSLDPKKGKQQSFAIGGLAPGAERKMQVVLVLPAVDIAPTGFVDLLDTAFTDTVFLSGMLSARIQDVQTSLSVAAEQRQGVYGAERLPGIFKSRNQSEVRVRFPATVPVQNDGKVRALILLSSLLFLALIIVALILRFQRVQITAIVDGIEVDRMSLPRISSQKLEKSGQTLGRVKRGWSNVVRFVAGKGFKSKRQGNSWLITPPSGSEMRVELKKGFKKRNIGSSKSTPGGF